MSAANGQDRRDREQDAVERGMRRAETAADAARRGGVGEARRERGRSDGAAAESAAAA